MMGKIILKLSAFACLFISVGFAIYLEDVRVVKKPAKLIKVLSIKTDGYQDIYSVVVDNSGNEQKYVLYLPLRGDTYPTGDKKRDSIQLRDARLRIGVPYINKYSKEYYNSLSFYFYLFTTLTLTLFVVSWVKDRI